jgi:adenine-specific DNA-methyltransferase
LDRSANLVFQAEATSLLTHYGSDLASNGTQLVIYADPPYSKAQYSRYYHVLETLVLYDYPEISGKGRYRAERFNTDFSRAGAVQEAMDRFINSAAQTGAPLYLSYPRNGLLYAAGGDVLAILKKHYAEAKLAATVPLAHSTLGAAPGKTSIDVTEDVYYAGHA